jgi:hypothetical protein
MSENIIALGGRSFEIEAFTFDQLRRLLPAFARLRNGLALGGLDAARDIIAAALDGQIAAEELASIKTDLAEIVAAIPVIARISGLSQMGEALAEEPTLEDRAH